MPIRVAKVRQKNENRYFTAQKNAEKSENTACFLVFFNTEAIFRHSKRASGHNQINLPTRASSKRRYEDTKKSSYCLRLNNTTNEVRQYDDSKDTNNPKSVISVMMIIALFLNLFVKPIERTQTCLKLALARKGSIVTEK